jgi:hypothetical protein
MSNLNYYLKIAVLPSDVRARNGINTETNCRYDGISQTGDYPPFELIKNHKGMLFFNLCNSDGTINSSDKRRADTWLQCTGGKYGNLSSIYTLELGTDIIIAYGNPSDKQYFKPTTQFLKDGTINQKQKPNHFFNYKNDGFVFLIKNDWSEIEIIVISNGKNIIQSVAKKVADKEFEDELTALRIIAMPIFI